MAHIRYVLQGRNQCGQACVAVLLDGKPLSEAIDIVGRRGYTRASHLDAALRKATKGRLRLSKRKRGGPALSGGRTVWLMAVRRKSQKEYWHWALARLDGPNVEIVWPTMYPQHIRGFVDRRKSIWPPDAEVINSWLVIERKVNK